MQRHLEPENIAELTAPVSDFEPSTIFPQPIPVNNIANAPEVLSRKEDKETHVQHHYNLQPLPQIVNVAVSPVHSQPPRVHPSLTSTNIPPNITHIQSRVAIRNYGIDPSIITSINVKIPQRKYAQCYGAANHALQLWQLQETTNANLPNEGFSGAIIDNKTGKFIEFCHIIKMCKYRDIWMKSFANELGRLARGIHDVPGTNTIDLIPKRSCTSWNHRHVSHVLPAENRKAPHAANCWRQYVNMSV